LLLSVELLSLLLRDVRLRLTHHSRGVRLRDEDIAVVAAGRELRIRLVAVHDSGLLRGCTTVARARRATTATTDDSSGDGNKHGEENENNRTISEFALARDVIADGNIAISQTR